MAVAMSVSNAADDEIPLPPSTFDVVYISKPLTSTPKSLNVATIPLTISDEPFSPI